MQFMKTIASNNAGDCRVYLVMVTRGQHQTVRRANDTRYRPVLDIKPPNPPTVKTADLPTFYEIKAEDFPPFGKKTRKIFLLGKYSDIFICR